LSKNNLPNFDRDSFPTHNSTPAPQVEFEIRHTREHLEKLKFIYLELYTKRGFLSHLTDSEEWRACQTTRWTPGELKQLERELEPSKTTLKAEKTKSAELQRILAEKCEAALCLQKDVQDKHEETSELMRRYREAEDTLRDLRETMPSAPTRSMEELQSILDEQSITLEKKTIALERQRSAVQDLERLLAIHEAENAKLMVIQTDLDARRTALTKEQSREDESLSKLCRWYASAAETLSQLTGCRVEMVQPDYLLANVSNVPVHIHVDSVTGKLRDVKVGSTSSTPKRQWKELVDAAIEFNDIPFLIRAIHAAANK
jgi:DNA repair exonuclease SbcCD ATPase subunit